MREHPRSPFGGQLIYETFIQIIFINAVKMIPAEHLFWGCVSVLLFVAYDGYCSKAPVPFYSSGDASLSFITGEAGTPKPVPPRQGTSFAFGINPQPIPHKPLDGTTAKPGGTPLTGPQVSPQLPQSTRDYVAPKPGTPQLPAGNIPQPPKPSVPPKPVGLQGSSQPDKTVASNTRDYVAPKPGTPQLPNIPKPSVPTRPSQVPSQPDKTITGQQPTPVGNPSGQPNPVGAQTPKPPRDPFPPLGPPKNQMRTSTPKPGSRDFVNPNFKPQTPGSVSLSQILNPSQPTKSPNDPFPPLRGASTAATPSTTPVLSYAQRAAGGVTTSKPQTSFKSPSGGTPKTPIGDTSSTTAEPITGPKDDELREFSEALLKKDVNNAFKYVKLNVQGKTTSQSKDDQAPEKLLEVDSKAYEIPTISKLREFYNNYILEVTENEVVTVQEKKEEADFLDLIVKTPVMQLTRNLLIKHDKISKDPADFLALLRTCWFSMYSRGEGRVGSSGFEHIFLAELKKSKHEVTGLHNWIYFHEAEQKNLANYLGYMKTIDLGEKGAILKFHFSFDGNDKPVNSIFVGTSPELEMALYTTCYVFRPNRVCPLLLNGNKFIVRAYSMRYRAKDLLGSAFPEI